MANFGPLTAEIGLGVWGTPANFNGFRVLPSSLQRRCSLEANQTLHDVWLSPGLVHYRPPYIHFWGLLPRQNFARCKIHFTSKSRVHPILAVLLHCTPAAGVSYALHHRTRNEITELLQSTYIRQGGHHVGHRPTFYLVLVFNAQKCV